MAAKPNILVLCTGNSCRSQIAEGWARVYWMTKADNLPARRLYDRFTRADDFVRYVIRQK